MKNKKIDRKNVTKPDWNKRNWNVGYWIIAFVLVLMIHDWWVAAQVEVVPYSEFEQALEQGRITEVLIGDKVITGKLKEGDSSGKNTIAASRVEPDLAERLAHFDVPYTRVVESTWLKDILSWVIPALIFFGVWFFLFRKLAERQGMGGFMTIGKSRAKVYVEAKTGVTFDDVAGVDEAKEELKEIVEFLKDPAEYGRLLSLIHI